MTNVDSNNVANTGDSLAWSGLLDEGSDSAPGSVWTGEPGGLATWGREVARLPAVLGFAA